MRSQPLELVHQVRGCGYVVVCFIKAVEVFLEGAVSLFGGDKVLRILYDDLNFAFVADYAPNRS